ncbi:MAG: VOC family protein [Pseudomonadales bacterium]
MIVGIHHVAIGVPDFEQGLKFYTEAFGFEVVQRSDWDRDFEQGDAAIGLKQTAAHMAMLKAPNAFIELWQYTNPPPADKRQAPNDYGYPHFALQVEDIEAEHARLTEAGMTFVGPVQNFGDSSAVYGADPFGNVIEIYEIRNADTAQLPRPDSH